MTENTATDRSTTGRTLGIRQLTVRAVNVPMHRPVHTSGGAVTSAPFLLLDLETDGGPVGSAYVFCYTPRMLAPMAALLRELGSGLVGDALAPLEIEAKLQTTFRLLGAQGLAGMALSGIDMAAWDACAKAAGLPLAALLGGTLRPTPAYNSCGLGIIGVERAREEARALAQGFRAIKVRLGYPSPADDVAVVRGVREAVGPDVRLMADYNQSLTVPEAQRRVAVLAEELREGAGVYWVEEPTRFDDYAGHARIRHKARLPIQLGENCWGPHDAAKALEAGACDYFMPDAGKIGGVTGWLRAVALAEPLGMPISCHLYPEVSAHLLAVTPTRHYLEYVDWANPILRSPLELKDGEAVPSAEPGSGIAWNEDAVAQHAVPV